MRMGRQSGADVVGVGARSDDDARSGWGAAGKTAENQARTGECVLTLPSHDLWKSVEKLAPLTRKHPAPEYRLASGFHCGRDKFDAAGVTALPSEVVSPPRDAECPLHLEALVRDVRPLRRSPATARAHSLLHAVPLVAQTDQETTRTQVKVYNRAQSPRGAPYTNSHRIVWSICPTAPSIPSMRCATRATTAVHAQV